MIIGFICLMKWIGMLMTWLDRFVEWDWTSFILDIVAYQVQEERSGFGPISLQKQNLGSVFAVYAVYWPGGPVDWLHWVKFSGTWRNYCFCIFQLQLPVDRPRARSTRHTGRCRPASSRLTGFVVYAVDREACVCGPPAKGQVDRANYEDPFSGVLFTIF